MRTRSWFSFASLAALVASVALNGCHSSDGGPTAQFGTPILSDLGTTVFPTSVIAGDFDGDGKTDVLVHTRGEKLRFLHGSGDGSFAAPRAVEGVENVQAAAVADLDGDRRPDLVVTGCAATQCYPWSLFTMRGKGDGSFDAPVSVASISGEPHVAIGDFNGDNLPDVAVPYLKTLERGITIFLGRGDGTLAAPTAWPDPNALGPPFAIVTADVNLDRKQDLIIFSDLLYIGHLSVLLGHGNGTFEPAPNSPVSVGTGSVAVVDFNRDGRPDVAAREHAGKSVGPQIISLGNGDGTFGSPLYTGMPPNFAAGNIDSDSIPDLVGAGYGAAGPEVVVGYGKGDGTFQPGEPIPLPFDGLADSLVDLNADGRLDLILRSATAVAVMLNTR
jgi:hypothetical protein